MGLFDLLAVTAVSEHIFHSVIEKFYWNCIVWWKEKRLIETIWEITTLMITTVKCIVHDDGKYANTCYEESKFDYTLDHPKQFKVYCRKS